jgi:hypothetical protein
LTDEAFRKARPSDTAERVGETIRKEVDAEKYGLHFYFNFGIVSELAEYPHRHEPMSYADQLLEQARHLAHRERKRPRQASLMRAVSTAYYAFFRLLISEATLNWKRPTSQQRIANWTACITCIW